jgi:hypothetical protein
MAWYLDYTSVANKILETPSLISLTGNFSIRFEAKYPAPSFRFMGSSTDNSRIELDTTARIRVTNASSTSVTLAFSGVDVTEFNEYEITRTGSTLSLSINGSAQSTTTLSGSINFNRFFRNAFANTSANCSVKYCEITIAGTLTHNYRNTTGTGDSWIDQQSANDAAQQGVWPAGNEEWVFYDDGGAVTSTIAATWPQLTIATSQTSTIPDTDSAAAFTWPQLSISADQLTIAPVSTSAAFNWPQLSVSASQSSAVPQFDSAVNFTWPQLTISAEQSAAYSGNVVNFTWPQLSVLANQSATIPDVETAASFTWPQLTVGINQITPSDNPEYNFPISGYRNNNQWRFSPFFKQTK